MATFVAIQLVVPISRLSDDIPRRFGWQMFSVARGAPTFVVTTTSGDTTVDLDSFVARARGDIVLEDDLPAHLCRVFPGAVRVSWESEQHEC